MLEFFEMEWIGPSHINFMTQGKLYWVQECHGDKDHFYLQNDIQHNASYIREYFFKPAEKKPELKENEFEFIGFPSEAFGKMTHEKIYVVDFDQSSRTHWSVRNDKAKRVLVPKKYFKSKIYKFALPKLISNPSFDTRSSSEYKGSNVTRQEVEFSIGWAKANPALFGKGVIEFFEENNSESWQLSVDNSRKGFITYIANKR